MTGLYFYTAIIGFAVGVGVASVMDIGFSYLMWGVVLAGILWMVARRGSDTSSSGNLAILSLFLIACVLGSVRFGLASLNVVNEFYDAQVGTQVMLQGIVMREPDVREKTTHLYIKVDDTLFLVNVPRYTQVTYGDLLSIDGKLEKPETFETDLGRTFNYPEYLHARGVSYTVSFAKITINRHNQGNPIIAGILAFKHSFMDRIERILPEPQVGLAEGLLLGVQQALGDKLEDVFRRTGIIHIVVLSGYNVMLVVIFIMYVLSYILPYRARFPFGVGAIICFAFLVGLSATVVRASVMAVLLLLARSMGRTYAVMRALMFAGAIMILINPYLLIYDVGFQLSFLATLGLLFLAPYIETKLHFMPTWFGAREFLTATISTQIFVMPILLYSIGQLSIVSVIVNVLVLPMVPVSMLLTFITGIVSYVSPMLATLIGFATTLSLSYILTVATFFAQVPFASFTVPIFPFWIVLVSYMLLGYGLYRVWEKQETASIEPLGLDEWVIEEEDFVIERIKKENSVTRSDGVTEEVPEFFR